MPYTSEWKSTTPENPAFKCRCGSNDVSYREWESDDGGHEDTHYRCEACGRDWWVVGAAKADLDVVAPPVDGIWTLKTDPEFVWKGEAIRPSASNDPPRLPEKVVLWRNDVALDLRWVAAARPAKFPGSEWTEFAFADGRWTPIKIGFARFMEEWMKVKHGR